MRQPSKWDLHDFEEMQNKIEKLHEQLDKESAARGSMSSGDTVDVDYFALRDVLQYVSDFGGDMKVMVELMAHAKYLSNIDM